jgi:hypothetical protein
MCVCFAINSATDLHSCTLLINNKHLNLKKKNWMSNKLVWNMIVSYGTNFMKLTFK